MAHFARGCAATTAIGRRLVGGDVLRTGHAFAGTGLIAGDFVGTADFITGDAVAVAGGCDANLGWRGGLGSGLTEGLEDFSSEIFGSCDRAAGAGLVPGCLDGTIGLGACDRLSGACGALADFPVSIRCRSLLGTIAIGAGWSGHSCTLLVAGAGLGAQLAHLLGQLATGEIRIGLAGNGRSTRGLLACCFAMFRHGFAARQDESTAGILNRATLRHCWTTIVSGAQSRSRCRCSGDHRGLGDGRGCCNDRLAVARDVSTIAIFAGIGLLATA